MVLIHIQKTANSLIYVCNIFHSPLTDISNCFQYILATRKKRGGGEKERSEGEGRLWPI